MRRNHPLLSRDEAGASAVEYGLLIAGIAALVAAIVFTFGGSIAHLFTNSCGTVGGQITTSGSGACS